jgi:hypothetical protein
MRWKAIFMALAFTDRASLWLVILPTWAPVLGAFSMACVCCDQGRQQLRGGISRAVRPASCSCAAACNHVRPITQAAMRALDKMRINSTTTT